MLLFLILSFAQINLTFAQSQTADGQLPQNIIASSSTDTTPNSLKLLATQAERAAVQEVGGFSLDTTDNITAQPDSQLLVFVSDSNDPGMWDYEQHCRDMLFAGLKWLEEHPNADPKYKGMKGFYGLILDDNEDAKELDKVVTFNGDCSGAQHHAVISHLFFIMKNGWDKYVVEMKKR